MEKFLRFSAENPNGITCLMFPITTVILVGGSLLYYRRTGRDPFPCLSHEGRIALMTYGGPVGGIILGSILTSIGHYKYQKRLNIKK